MRDFVQRYACKSLKPCKGESHHGCVQTVKTWIGALTEIGLMLLALGDRLRIAGRRPNIPFFGNVVGQHHDLRQRPRANGLVGLIALGVILWLFSQPQRWRDGSNGIIADRCATFRHWVTPYNGNGGVGRRSLLPTRGVRGVRGMHGVSRKDQTSISGCSSSSDSSTVLSVILIYLHPRRQFRRVRHVGRRQRDEIRRRRADAEPDRLASCCVIVAHHLCMVNAAHPLSRAAHWRRTREWLSRPP